MDDVGRSLFGYGKFDWEPLGKSTVRGDAKDETPSLQGAPESAAPGLARSLTGVRSRHGAARAPDHRLDCAVMLWPVRVFAAPP